MGNGESLESVKGHGECPYDLLSHNHNDHPEEEDVCDDCQEEKTCVITCEAPKSRKLHRVCYDCTQLRKDKRRKETEESILSIENTLKFGNS